MLVTVHCCEAGVRLSRINRNGEEVLEAVPPEILQLAAKLWAAVARAPLEGHAAVDKRLEELRHEVGALRQGHYAAIVDLQRRVATLEQPIVRELRQLAEPARSLQIETKQ